jgi:hypothetical protein
LRVALTGSCDRQTQAAIDLPGALSWDYTSAL